VREKCGIDVVERVGVRGAEAEDADPMACGRERDPAGREDLGLEGRGQPGREPRRLFTRLGEGERVLVLPDPARRPIPRSARSARNGPVGGGSRGPGSACSPPTAGESRPRRRRSCRAGEPVLARHRHLSRPGAAGKPAAVRLARTDYASPGTTTCDVTIVPGRRRAPPGPRPGSGDARDNAKAGGGAERSGLIEGLGGGVAGGLARIRRPRRVR
jgi:hypothetical protein